MQIEFVKLIYLGEGKNVENNEIALELIQALNKIETDFGLSEILQAQDILKDKSVTVGFKWGDGTSVVCQRNADPSNGQCSWSQSDGQCLESFERKQPNGTLGEEVAEILNKADMVSTFKSVLRKHSMTVSEEKPVMVLFNSNDGFEVVLRCPCPNFPRRCCQVAV